MSRFLVKKAALSDPNCRSSHFHTSHLFFSLESHFRSWRLGAILTNRSSYAGKSKIHSGSNCCSWPVSGWIICLDKASLLHEFGLFWIPKTAANALQEFLACRFVHNILFWSIPNLVERVKLRIPFLALCPAAILERIFSNRFLDVYLCGTVEEVQFLVQPAGIWWIELVSTLVVFQRSLGLVKVWSLRKRFKLLGCFVDRSADLELPNCQAKLRVKRSGMIKCFERRGDLERLGDSGETTKMMIFGILKSYWGDI